MGNILYGDLDSEHMIYTADNSIESAVRSLYMSCNNLMAGYYYSHNIGIWSYVYKYNARNAGYLSGYCSSDISAPVKSFDSITFSDVNQFEKEDYKGTLVLSAEDDFIISKATAVNIINQIFRSWSENKPVFLMLSNYEKSTADYLIDGLRVLKTILRAFPDELQKHISFLINTIPLKNSGLKIHLMFLPKDYNESYIKEWQRKFPYSVIDCTSDIGMPDIIPPYIDYLAGIISGESEKNPVAENFLKCINYSSIELNGINMDIFSNVYSLYYFSEENFKERSIRTTYRKLYNNKKLCNLNKISELLNDKASKIISQINSELTAQAVESTVTPVTESNAPVNELPDENEQPVNLSDKLVTQDIESNTESDSENKEHENKIRRIMEKKNPAAVESVQPDLTDNTPEEEGFNESKLAFSSDEKNFCVRDAIYSDAQTKQKPVFDVPYKNLTPDNWIYLLCIFSEVFKKHGDTNVSNETIELFKSMYKRFERKDDFPKNALLHMTMIKSYLFQEVYTDAKEKGIEYTHLYRDSEYIGTAMFMNFAHRKWMQTQRYSKVELSDANKRCSFEVDIAEAIYIFFIVLYMYYITRAENGREDDCYIKLIGNLEDKLKKENLFYLFESEYINSFLQENYRNRQNFLLFMSFLFCDIILQINFPDSKKNILQRFKRNSAEDNERRKIAQECSLETFIKKIKSYVDNESATTAFVSRYMKHKYNDKNIEEYIDKFNWEQL